MGPSKQVDQATMSSKASHDPARPRRGSLPELKSSAEKEKKVPTGPKANPLYKTRLCMNYQSTGSCPYTDKCQFAHGIKELEKWEQWRSSHKPSESSKSSDEHSEGTRSRSQSLEKSGRTVSSDSRDATQESFGSPQSTSWEMQTPVKRELAKSDLTPISGPLSDSSFSLWSTMLDDLDSEHPIPWSNNRPRAATYDSTYDNISQLRDAPTLFPSPPVLRDWA